MLDARPGRIRYRQAALSDVPEMIRIREDDAEGGPADRRMGPYFEGRHHPQKALVPRVGFVAHDGELMIGYIAGHLTTRYACEGEVQYLYVAPAYRRHGVATELLRLLAEWFTRQGARRICVDVAEDSPAARPFYVRHGAAPLNRHFLVWDDIRPLPQDDAISGVPE